MLRKTLLSVCTLLILSACGAGKTEAVYPEAPEDARRLKKGKITGEEGLVILGENSIFSGKRSGGEQAGAVNSFLWRASLETVSFLPVTSADPNGGVIITDWYEDPETLGERFRVNVMVLDTELRSDAVRVNVFKQRRASVSDWQNIPVDRSLASNLEDTILAKARSLRIKAQAAE